MRDQRKKPYIAVTIGDPAGIGPEIVASFLAGFAPNRSIAAVIGAPSVLEPWAARFGWKMRVASSESALFSGQSGLEGTVLVIPTECVEEVPVGENSAAGGRHAGEAVAKACELANKKHIDAIVTAPISKKSLSLAGYDYPGHTEMLADMLKAQTCEMMMVYKKLRVVPLTRHLSLNSVSSQISRDRVVSCLVTVARALESLFGLKRPRLACAALNPHAGDQGLLGDEEIRILQPALEHARSRGIDVSGPIPGDVVFQSIRGNVYDAYIAMYHDQGLIPFKMVARAKGVNLTIGLPVIRTSVDHGVAMDIAGEGRADITSIRAAYSLAEKLAGIKMKADAA